MSRRCQRCRFREQSPARRCVILVIVGLRRSTASSSTARFPLPVASASSSPRERVGRARRPISGFDDRVRVAPSSPRGSRPPAQGNATTSRRHAHVHDEGLTPCGVRRKLEHLRTERALSGVSPQRTHPKDAFVKARAVKAWALPRSVTLDRDIKDSRDRDRAMGHTAAEHRAPPVRRSS